MEHLKAQRAELAERIGRLPPHAFRRIALEGRQAAITQRLLELEMAAPAAPKLLPAPPPEREHDKGHELKYWQK